MNGRQRYVSKFDELRGRYGKGKCGNCGKELPKRRRFWCSDECVHAVQIQGKDWSVLRWKIIKERRKCAHCGTFVPKKQVKKWSVDGLDKGDLTYLDADGWVGDHITPIALGGAEFDENNIQLLCPKCNKVKTKQDMADIADARRKARAEEKLKTVKRLDKF